MTGRHLPISSTFLKDYILTLVKTFLFHLQSFKMELCVFVGRLWYREGLAQRKVLTDAGLLPSSFLINSSSLLFLCCSHFTKSQALLSSMSSEGNDFGDFGPQLWQSLCKQGLSAFPSSVSDLRIFPETSFVCFSFFFHF